MSEHSKHESTPWKIVYIDQDDKPIRRIINSGYSVDITAEAYNHQINTPIALAPISKTNTLVLSEYRTKKDGIGLRLTDLRVVGGVMTSSINIILRGSQTQLKKTKYDFLKAADSERCVGVSFMLRKLYYHGFSTLYAPKKIRPRESNSLQTAFDTISDNRDEKTE